MRQLLLTLLTIPLFISCQEQYSTSPYDDNERGFREFNVEKAKTMVLDSLWKKRDSLTYLRLKNLEVMMISESSEIPSWIGSFKKLKIFLSSNEKRKIEYIPSEISELTSLIELNLPNNNISSLPHSLYQLKSLNNLNLSNNPLSSLSPQIGNLQHLQSLDLSKTNISELPNEICYLNQLELLALEDTPLKTLPQCLGELPHLDWLNISGTQVTKLPIELLNAPKLEKIYAKGIRLKNHQEVKKISIERGIKFYYDE